MDHNTSSGMDRSPQTPTGRRPLGIRDVQYTGMKRLDRIPDLAQQLKHVISEEINDLQHEWGALDQQKKTLQVEKAAMGLLCARDTDVVHLNVGGQHFMTKRATLTQMEGSLLAGLFSGRWEGSQDLSNDGSIFLDLDPACFEILLSELRYQLLTRKTVDWCRVQAPEGKERHFRAMLEFLGIVTALIMKFEFWSSDITCSKDGSIVKNASRSIGHKYAIGDTTMSAGIQTWGIKISAMLNDNWVFLGIIAHTHTAPTGVSQNDTTAYGWGCQEHVFKAGQCSPAPGSLGWTGFHEGDIVKMQLNCNTGALKMKLSRLPGQVFTIDGLGRGQWRVHVVLYQAGDELELIAMHDF